MASIFNTLSIGYSGLNAAQVGITTTGSNITNAETEGYSRQRVITSSTNALKTSFGQVGNGTEVTNIKRVFDNFVFDRYNKISSEKEYSDYQKQMLEQLSTYFPEIDGVGIKADLSEYYNMWQTFSDNPNNDAIKVALAKQTEILARHITQTQSQVSTLQNQINEELAVNVNQVNDLASQLANLNKAIDIAESGDASSANDLRDKRNVLERSLSRLIGAKPTAGQLTANTQIGSNSNTRTGSYTLTVNGFNIVDGSTFHPLKVSKTDNQAGFYDLSFERQDGVLIPLEETISGGKIGAILDLRGRAIDTVTGAPTDGTLQNVVTQLDSFAQGLIESTNNLYAAAAVYSMQSNIVTVEPVASLVSSNLNIKEGSFNLSVYDIDGNVVAKREIKIDNATSMNGPNANSIEEQIKAQADDNNDGNANNDIDDYFDYNYTPSGAGDLRLELFIKADKKSSGYKFSIEDNLPTGAFNSGTNFAGALGMSRFFDGNNAKNINLTKSFTDNPTKMDAGFSGINGDNRLAINMIQQQFEAYDFQVGNQVYNTTMYGMFDVTATYIGTQTNAVLTQNDTINTQFNSTELQYYSVSKVSIDQEMAQLIKYQTSYGAAAKVITTIDQMMQTLLGIKQ